MKTGLAGKSTVWEFFSNPTALALNRQFPKPSWYSDALIDMNGE